MDNKAHHHIRLSKINRYLGATVCGLFLLLVSSSGYASVSPSNGQSNELNVTVAQQQPVTNTNAASTENVTVKPQNQQPADSIATVTFQVKSAAAG